MVQPIETNQDKPIQQDKNDMKKLYNLLLRTLMVAAMVFGTKQASATCKSLTGMDFNYSNKCLTYSFEGKNLQNGCIKYSWKIFSNTTQLTAVNGRTFSYAFSGNGSYTVRMAVQDTCNKCDTVIYKTVTVNCNTCNWSALKPTIYVSAQSNTCLKYVFGINDLGDTCIKYSWTLDGKSHASYNNYPRYMTDSFTSNGTHTICVHLVNSCKNCDTTICTTINAQNCKTSKCNWSGMDFGMSNKCRTWTFEGKNTSNGCLKYQFYVYTSPNTGYTLSPGRVASYTFSATGTFTVKMTVRDTCKNCDTSISKAVYVDCNPCGLTPTWEWKADCRKVKFVATGNTSGATYYWYFGDGSTGSGKDPSHTFVKDGVYKVCMYMTWKDPNTGETCKKEACKEIKIQCGTPCEIKGDFTFASKAGLVKFNASSNTGLYYEWDFGDGTTGTGKDPSHQYKKPGTYNVCVKISDKTRRCSVTICKKVVIEDPCNLKGDFTWGISNGTVKFYATGNGTYYSWNFGDGSTGTGKDPSHTYKPGTYTVCVTIYGSNTRCSLKICKTVIIPNNDKCAWAKNGAGFSYSVVCPKLTLEAKNMNNGCIKYSWAINAVGSSQSTTFNGRVQTITFSSNGTFNVCLKLVDTCRKCDTVICKTIEINCFSKCNWKANNPYFSVWDSCKSLSGYIGFNSSKATCFKYTWKVNGTVVSHDRYLKSFGISKNGTYDLCCTVVDTCNKCDTTFCGSRTITCFRDCNWKAKYPNFVTFTAGSKCLNIEAGLNTSNYGCIRQYYSLAGVSAGYDGKTYHSWTVSKAGTYTICVKLIDTCSGCDTTLCKEVTVTSCCTPWTGAGFTVSNNSSKCMYTFTGKSLSKSCLKYQYTLSTSSTGGGYVIGKTSTIDYQMTANGTYYVCLKITDTCNNCDTTICQTVKVDCACSAKAGISIDSTSSAGIVYLHSTSTGAYYYEWDFGDSSSSTSSNPAKHAYKASGAYNICLTVWDANKTCSTKYCITVKVLKTRSVAGISNASTVVPVHVYPNPASTGFVITTMGNASYQIYDLKGRLVTSGNMDNRTSVNADGWMDGVYLVRITTSEGTATTRVVIQK